MRDDYPKCYAVLRIMQGNKVQPGNLGMIHVYTGEAKGKTTAALGLALRAAGHGLKVIVVQFFKKDTGEKATLSLHNNISFMQFARQTDFFRKYSDQEHAFLKTEFSGFWDSVIDSMRRSKADLLILDEVAYALSMGLYPLSIFLDFLDNKPLCTEIVLTGRGFPEEVISKADYVTEMKLVKHPFVSRKTPARRGIEY